MKSHVVRKQRISLLQGQNFDAFACVDFQTPPSKETLESFIAFCDQVKLMSEIINVWLYLRVTLRHSSSFYFGVNLVSYGLFFL